MRRLERNNRNTQHWTVTLRLQHMEALILANGTMQHFSAKFSFSCCYTQQQMRQHNAGVYSVTVGRNCGKNENCEGNRCNGEGKRQAMYVERNTGARSFNHCCNGKEKGIKHFVCVCVCVCVAIGIHHTMRRRHIVICGLPGCTYNIFKLIS